MIPTIPEVSKSGRYAPKQTCEALGISLRTLQNHTKEGLIKCGRRRSNGRPFYEGSEIIRYWRDTL